MWCELLDPQITTLLPSIKVDIVLNENSMGSREIDFQPNFVEFVNSLRNIVDKIAYSINAPGRVRIVTLQGFLNGDDDAALEIRLSQTVMDNAYQQLAQFAEHYFREPKQLIRTFEEKYNFLIDGRAATHVQQFNTENHNFDGYTQVSERCVGRSALTSLVGTDPLQ
jgi:hypothetical protein